MKKPIAEAVAKFFANFGTSIQRQRGDHQQDWAPATRHAHIMANSQPLEAVWHPRVHGVAQVVNALVQKDIRLRAPHPGRMNGGVEFAAYGLTELAEGLPPLIWINFNRHQSHHDPETELADTLIHQGIMASAIILGRHEVLPDDPNSLAYYAERACCCFGTSFVQEALRIGGARKNWVLAMQLGESMPPGLLADVKMQAEDAARWVVAEPSLLT